MKKTVLVLMLGILLIAGNLYADGDLYVNGNLGVGTESPTAKLDVRGTMDVTGRTSISNTNEYVGFNVSNTLDRVGTKGDYVIGAQYNARLTGDSIGSVYGLAAVTDIDSSAPTVKEMYGAFFSLGIGGGADPDDPDGVTAVKRVVGFSVDLTRNWRNVRTYDIDNSYGIQTYVNESADGGGPANMPVNITNHYHLFMDEIKTGKLTMLDIENLAGLWVKKQTAGTNNHGIVLAGDGAGADISFGSSQETQVYGSLGDLMVDTAQGKGIIVRATNGPNCFRLIVNNAGDLSTEGVACP